VKITIDIDDDEIRRLLAPLIQQTPPSSEGRTPTRLMTVKDVADRLGVSRNKVYQLLYRREIASLTIGRTRRISHAALAQFIARPVDGGAQTVSPPPRQHERSLRNPEALRDPPARLLKSRREPKSAVAIDLSPKPLSPGLSGPNMTNEDWEELLATMVEKGWPADVVDQIRDDRIREIHRVNALTVSDTAKYLGLSRYGVEKLVKTGRLRLFTISSTYRDDKPEKRIPAKDVLALN
jgi:excisionase family DNA binding protein